MACSGGRRRQQAEPAITPADPVAPPPATLLVAEVLPEDEPPTGRWDLGGIEIEDTALWTKAPAASGPDLGGSPAVRETFAALVGHLPQIARLGGELSGRSYVVKFSPELARGLADKSFSLMQAQGGGLRANVVGEGGRIVGQGTLHTAAMAPLAALAVWQVLAVVTAKKYLADIDRKLAGIATGVASIQRWLEDERRGRVTGNLRYLREVATRIQAQSLSPAEVAAFANQLEAIERELQQLHAAQLPALQRHAGKAETMQMSGDRLAENSKAAFALLDEFENDMRPMLYMDERRAAQAEAGAPVEESITALGSQLDEHLRRLSSPAAVLVQLSASGGVGSVRQLEVA